MKQVVLILAMAALTIAAAPPTGADKSSATKAKCSYTIQQANAAAGRAAPRGDNRPDDHRPGLIRAVDKRLGGCPVLVMADGKMMAPPTFTDGPASKSPAQ